jgi:hypothetical protein
MVDSYGVGWNGAVLTINGADFILNDNNPDCTSSTDCNAQGLDDQTATAEVCLVDFLSTTYSMTCGTFSYEVSWSVSCPGGLEFPDGGLDADCSEGSGVFAIEGCTDPEAFNYNSAAVTEDGSCIPVVEGCTDM